MRLDIRGSDVLRDVVLLISQSDREVQRAIRTYTKSLLTRPWLDAINAQASSPLQQRVISATATVAVSNQNIRIQSAAKGRRLSGGLSPKEAGGAVEFGSTRYKQFGRRSRKGNTFFPASRKMIPRLASLWVQTVVKTYALILEGK